MRSGTKNAYCTIYRSVESADPNTNAPIYTPAVWKNAWAEVTPRRGREVVIDDQIAAKIYLRFNFDYFDVVGIRETDIIEVDSVRYGIAGLLPDVNNKEYFTVDAEFRSTGTERG